MGASQDQRKPRPVEKKPQTGPQPGDEEEIKKKREEAEAVAVLQRQQEERRTRELDAMNARVDQALSKNSQEFLNKATQPGGQ